LPNGRARTWRDPVPPRLNDRHHWLCNPPSTLAWCRTGISCS